MPLPMPTQGEARDDFLSRCAGDEKMNAEFPEQDKRLAVCANLYDNQGDMERLSFSILCGEMPSARQVAHFRQTPSGGTHTWEAEVFAVGTWNGYTFSEADLEKMVESFKLLNGGGYLEVPLKFGHNDEQPMTDGTPALGWVTDLYIKKDDKGRSKLMASLDSVPGVVYDAVKAGRYRKVSIELEFDVKHKGTMYPYVMTGIALLGADLPAVNTLADLTTYMGRDSMVAARSASFSAVSGKLEKEGKTMAEIDDKELAELRAQAAKTQQLEAEKAQFERDQAAKAVKDARDNVNGILDQAVTDMRVTPAQRAGFAKLLRVDDDEAVVGITVADIEAVLPAKPEGDKGGDTFGRTKPDEGAALDTDEKLDRAAHKIIAESGGKMRYARALELAMQADPETARAHVITVAE